jgi:hypothetical protein
VVGWAHARCVVRPAGPCRRGAPARAAARPGAALGIPGITAHRAVFADGRSADLAQLKTTAVALDAAVAKNEAVIAAYATREDRPTFPFWPMLFGNVVIRLIGSDDFPPPARQQAVADLTTAANEGALSIAIGEPLPLARAAEAHDRVDAGTRERVLLAIPE